MEFAAETVSDPILVRSAIGKDGLPGAAVPVYNYVVTIDDALMRITHVIRGDDHISNTPKQVAIYRGLRLAGAGVCAPLDDSGRGPRAALKAPRSHIHCDFPRDGVPARGAGELPGPAWLGRRGWQDRDLYSKKELIDAFSLERVTASPAVFDLDKLNWLNRHSIKQADPGRLAALAWGYFAGCLPARKDAPQAVLSWFDQLLAVFLPAVDRLDQLPEKAAAIFGFEPEAARAEGENVRVLAADSARTVLSELAARVRAHAGNITAEVFKDWMNEVKVAAGVKGPDLFHPVRIALTGAHSGREFDKLIPLIEAGSALGLGLPSVRQRIERFVGV